MEIDNQRPYVEPAWMKRFPLPESFINRNFRSWLKGQPDKETLFDDMARWELNYLQISGQVCSPQEEEFIHNLFSKWANHSL